MNENTMASQPTMTYYSSLSSLEVDVLNRDHPSMQLESKSSLRLASSGKISQFGDFIDLCHRKSTTLSQH